MHETLQETQFPLNFERVGPSLVGRFVFSRWSLAVGEGREDILMSNAQPNRGFGLLHFLPPPVSLLCFCL